MKNTHQRLALVMAGWFAGCSSGPDAQSEPAPAVPAEPAPAAEVAAPAPAVQPEEAVPADLPVAEDFEEESERSITASTYKGDLDLLAKEIEADSPPT